MTFRNIRIAAAAAALLFIPTLQLSAQNAANPIEVALQRWYPVNTATTIPTCTPAYGVAFDGAHIWAACGAANELMEYNASDNTLVRTVTGVVAPRGLLYDGANVWASNYGSPGTVTKVQSSTGTVLGTFAVGPNPVGLTFDGQYVWVANSLNYGGVSKVLATTGAVTNYALPTCGSPYGMAFDGTNIWVSCTNTNNVLKLSPTGSVLNTVTAASTPLGVAYDGNYIWVASSSGTVYKILARTPSTKVSYAVSCPAGVVFDSLFIWVTSPCANTVTKLVFTTGSMGTYAAPSTSSFIASDGGNIWVSNTTTGTLAKF